MNQYLKIVNFFSLLFSIVIFFIACKSKNDSNKLTPKPNAPVLVDVLVAQEQPSNNIIEVNGSVIPNEYVELHPEISGRLTFLNVPEGKLITAGTIIAKINNADLVAQQNKSKVQLNLAQKTLDRYKQLLAVNGINQSDYDAALNQVNGFKADIDYTQTLIDKTIVKAPFTGIVGLRQVSPGAYVTPTTLIATLQQTSQLKIDFTLPQMYSGVIKNGSTIDVSLNDNTIKNKAVIFATEPSANTDTRNLKVRAILKAKANPGSFAKVYIDAGKQKDAINVPSNCIIPDDRNNQLVIVKNGLAKFVNVQTGVRTANTVAITQGINAGDSVIVTGVLFAKPNAPLKIRSVKNINAFTAISTN